MSGQGHAAYGKDLEMVFTGTRWRIDKIDEGMRAMDRLNSLDASFIDAEDQDRHASFAIASIAVFEGPAPSYEEFLAAIAGRLPLVPFYRKKLRMTPFRLGPPAWVDDPISATTSGRRPCRPPAGTPSSAL